MSKAKTKLSSIGSEVEEFHPLLDKLLPKLPNVIDVEYTHGSGEMGADFVLSTRNETFQDTEYVGVIAKVGKVVQDFSGIQRQIDECEIPRTFFGGKKRIRITEIWVMITEHITKGAQEKIHEKYKQRKIKFIDGSRLEKLIDKHIPTFWTDITLEVGDYLTIVRSKNKEIDRNTSLLPFADSDFYIEPDISEIDTLDYDKKTKTVKKKGPIKSIFMIRLTNRKLFLLKGGWVLESQSYLGT
jgi:hypothetical protein